jgi:hypothetical protein
MRGAGVGDSQAQKDANHQPNAAGGDGRRRAGLRGGHGRHPAGLDGRLGGLRTRQSCRLYLLRLLEILEFLLGVPGVVAPQLTVVTRTMLAQALQYPGRTPSPLRWCPARQRHMKRPQCVPRPTMSGDPRCHGRRRLPCLRQTHMRCAKVRDRAHQAHPRLQRHGVACPPRRVEPLHVRRIDPPVPWRPASARLHMCRCAIDTTTCGRDHPPPWRPTRTRVPGIMQGLPHGPAGGHHASGTAQQGAPCGTAPHPRS